jgi:hypothetical protein
MKKAKPTKHEPIIQIYTKLIIPINDADSINELKKIKLLNKGIYFEFLLFSSTMEDYIKNIPLH